MRRGITRALLAAVSAGVTITTFGITGAAAAGTAPLRARGPDVYNGGLTGYQDGGGRWFRFVSTTLTVPARTLPISAQDDAYIGLAHNGGPTPRPYAQIHISPGEGLAASATTPGEARARSQ